MEALYLSRVEALEWQVLFALPRPYHLGKKYEPTMSAIVCRVEDVVPR